MILVLLWRAIIVKALWCVCFEILLKNVCRSTNTFWGFMTEVADGVRSWNVASWNEERMKISAKLIFFVSTFMIGSLCSLLIIPAIQKLSFFFLLFVLFCIFFFVIESLLHCFKVIWYTRSLQCHIHAWSFHRCLFFSYDHRSRHFI